MIHSMLPVVSRSLNRALMAVLLAVFLLAVPESLRAGSTGTTALHTPQGSGAGTANGDYITADSGGLDEFYRYWIEVPPGLSRLVVEVFDPDIGDGGGGEDTAGRDRDRDGYNTQVDYDLIRPDGSTAASLNNCDDNTCNDNTWTEILNSTTAQNTAAGHWELRIDLRSSETTGNDINAFGIRAHDGTTGSGGTELNVYYDSHAQFGVNPDPGSNSRSYTLHPYLTSGCSAAKNDFDFDSNSGTTGSMTFSSRTGAFNQSYTSSSLSTNNSWRRDSFTGWTSDTQSVGYGIWTAAMTINTYTVGGTVNGNYANLWMSNFQAAANPPGANPTTNAFRVYLPTDGGTAPVKPYVEQLATFSGCGLSGPNPPVVGQTSCFTVTVRVVNPATQSITFSAVNLVTANVPGSGAVYAGGAQVSQGSIVSQPSVGGTGNITWNPGTVSAGATALLSYRINVTPTSAGQRIPLTATPASGSGTRAQFVDTTGNTTQGRATYLFGPLCELAVTENLLTQAVVSDFHAARADGGGVLVEWQTASEAGTAGFNLYRRDRATGRWVRANRELLTGLLHAEQGGTYRFVDAGVSAGEPQVYRLEEVEAGGRRRVHGPFRVAVDWERPDPRQGVAAYERSAHAAPRRPAAEMVIGLESVASAVRTPGKADGMHLSVDQTGLYYLSTAEVAAWLGATPDKAAKWIGEGKLSLTRGGQAVAWYPDLPPGGKPRDKKDALGLFFYGEAPSPDSLYTKSSVYRLERDKNGLLMQTVPAGSSPAVAGGAFPESLHDEVNAFAATVISPNPESDYWFWEFLQGDDASFGKRTFSLDAPGLSGTGGGTLAIGFHGATASGVTDEHRAEVALNGTPLGEVRWTGIAPQAASFAVPPGLLLAAGNQVEVTAHTGAGAPFSIFYVDGFDLSYLRSFQAVDNALAFTPGGNPQVTVGGFSSAAVRLLDIQDPLRPRWITGAAVEADDAPAGFRLTFTPTPSGRYLAAAALKTPAAVRPWSAPALRSAANRADYLVIAPAGLTDAAERLADLRRAQGLEALVVDLDQIMDELNAGSSSPHAIRDFLAYAYGAWSQAPRYVALAGEGTLDYRNLLGFGDNLVSPLMVQAPGGLFPSDNRFGDVDGDGVAEMAVGRIPVLTATELDAYTAKIAAYESVPAPDWASKAVMIADATDGGADFAVDSDRIADQIPAGYTVDRIYLSTTPFGDARSRLLAEIGAGASFLNYTGHGALDRLSAGGLLTNGDVPGLANGERLPVLTALTCTVNRFAVPGIPALGELLVKSGSGGVAAVWGPTGLSSHGGAEQLGERFYHATDARLGDRVLRAVAEFNALGGDAGLLRIYDLLGDPALRLQLPPEVPGEPIATGE